jgi:hypothetical protein
MQVCAHAPVTEEEKVPTFFKAQVFEEAFFQR